MIVKLPHIEPIDTLSLKGDFEEQVKESFARFTEGTNKDYTYLDKLLYLDNLRRVYLQRGVSTNPTAAVKEPILDRAEWNLDEYGDLPNKEEYLSLEFMEACYEKGRDINFRIGEIESSSSRNDETMKVIARIIQIVMNWEQEG